MSAPTAAVNPIATPPPVRPAADQAPSAGDHRFDHHLDAARQQQGQAQDSASQDGGGHPPQAKTAPDAKPAKPAPAKAATKDDSHSDAAALAAAMLALIGQAAPAKPLAQATTAMQVPTKAVAGTHAATAPAALVLLAGAAAGAVAGAAAAKPAINLDANALAPMLAKPAEQKDAPMDATTLAGLATTPLPAPDAGAAVTAPAHSLDIASPVGTPAFGQELGQQIAWLGSQDVKQARIRLHPEELGALDVKVSINHDRVDVSFAVQHPAAVHALQQTLPQLDTLLAHHGLALGQADVGQRQQQGDGARSGEATRAIGEVEAEPAAVASTPVAALGMLDTFA